MLKKIRFRADHKNRKGFKTEDELRKPDESRRKNESNKSENLWNSTGDKEETIDIEEDEWMKNRDDEGKEHENTVHFKLEQINTRYSFESLVHLLVWLSTSSLVRCVVEKMVKFRYVTFGHSVKPMTYTQPVTNEQTLLQCVLHTYFFCQTIWFI